MDPSRFARVRELYLTARSLDPDTQEAYLHRECGEDEALLREVRSILNQRGKTGSLLESRALGDLLSAQLLAELPPPQPMPARIGPYRIVGILGVGGMGVVYRAEQTSPIQRQVALKLIRGDLGSRRASARFDAERQALARMDHPNIARVLEAGSDDLGRPYFVMELVRGIPITDFCETNRLPLRRRLELFRTVCLAVQHAHQKGIIHRDLKPSNILITLQDGTAQPKLIDFGIAKALDDSGEQGTRMTRDGQMIGTIEYMSPEQAGGSSAAVDTRSDLYSLGVILYELVTGMLPYAVKGRTPLEVLRAINEEHPPRLKGLRSTAGRLDPDIEAIVFKTLEKDPDRRYSGVGALAEDLERYLESQPVLARSPSVIYQVRKFVGRNKTVSVLGAVVLITLPMAVVTMFMALNSQKSEALKAESITRVNAWWFENIDANRIEGSSGNVHYSDILKSAAERIGKLQPDPVVEAELHRTIGGAFRHLNEDSLAVHHLRAALTKMESSPNARPRDLIIILNDLAEYHGTRMETAEQESLLLRALDLGKQLHGQDEVHLGRSKNLLARARADQGFYEEAENLYREGLAIREKLEGSDSECVASSKNDLAVFLWNRGRLEEAEPLYNDALQVYEQIHGTNHTDVATITDNYGVLLTSIGRCREAEPYHRLALETRARLLGDSHRMIGASHNNLACCLEAQGRYAEAEEHLNDAARVLRACLGDHHPWVALPLHSLARNMQIRGELEEAEALYDEALRIRQEVLPPEHDDALWTQVWLSSLWMQRDEAEKAEPVLGKCLDLCRERYPLDHWKIAIVRNILGRCLVQLGNLDEGDSLLDVSRLPMRNAPIYEKRLPLQQTAELYERRGKHDEAERYRSEISRADEIAGLIPQ